MSEATPEPKPYLRRTIPVLRIFDVKKAKEFYVDWLGFEVEWIHPDWDDSPVFIEISRDKVFLHLSEHHGDACPGALVGIPTHGLDEYLQELRSRPYEFYNPGIETMPWNVRQMMITDPFGNRVNFMEPVSAGDGGQARETAQAEGPVVVEQTYPVAIEVVWRAITEPERMRQWYFEPIQSFRAEPGFETSFTVHAEGEDYLHLWKVLEVEAPNRLSYEWKYGGYDGESVVSWQLSETEDGTRLELTHSGGESFTGQSPIFTRELCVGGWEYFLQQALKQFLA